MKNKTQPEKIDKILSEHGITRISPYINLHTKIKLKKGNEEWWITARSVLTSKLRSPSEIKAIKRNVMMNVIKTKIISEEDLKEKLPKNIEYISGYSQVFKSAVFRCKECNNNFVTKPEYILQGHGCPQCGRKHSHNRKSTAKFKEEVNKLTNGEYEVIGEYKGQLVDIKIRHNKCKREYFVKPKFFLRGDRCSVCLDKKKSNSKNKFQTFIQAVSPQYTLLSFEGMKKNATLYNTRYNEYLVTTPQRFINGTRSISEKNVSHGENIIRDILSEKNIPFIMHYKEKTLIDKRPLEFDFLIMYNNLEYRVEYNGEQHFYESEFFGGKKYLENISKHDKQKIDFCKSNNYPFLILTFKDDINSIRTKLENFLN